MHTFGGKSLKFVLDRHSDGLFSPVVYLLLLIPIPNYYFLLLIPIPNYYFLLKCNCFAKQLIF